MSEERYAGDLMVRKKKENSMHIYLNKWKSELMKCVRLLGSVDGPLEVYGLIFKVKIVKKLVGILLVITWHFLFLFLEVIAILLNSTYILHLWLYMCVVCIYIVTTCICSPKPQIAYFSWLWALKHNIYIFFFLEANYFTTFQWVLSYTDMNQPWSYMYFPLYSLLWLHFFLFCIY